MVEWLGMMRINNCQQLSITSSSLNLAGRGMKDYASRSQGFEEKEGESGCGVWVV